MNKWLTKSCAFFCCISAYLLGSSAPPYSELFIPDTENIEQSAPSDISIGCVFKNEAPWLKEWIEYHRLIGVDHFYLYNNCSNDHYREVLLPYIKKGIVELFDFPKPNFSNKDQNYMYNHTLALAKQQSKWLAIIDTDEFINPLSSKDLKTYLQAKQRAASVYITWQIFGTSGIQEIEPEQLLIEKLIFRAPNGDPISEAWGKSIYQCQYTNSIDSAHKGTHPPRAYIAYPSTNKIKINHYFFRTENYLYNVKLPRLVVWTAGHQFKSQQGILNYLPIANSTKDTFMEHYVPFLKNKIFNNP